MRLGSYSVAKLIFLIKTPSANSVMQSIALSISWQTDTAFSKSIDDDELDYGTGDYEARDIQGKYYYCISIP